MKIPGFPVKIYDYHSISYDTASRRVTSIPVEGTRERVEFRNLDFPVERIRVRSHRAYPNAPIHLEIEVHANVPHRDGGGRVPITFTTHHTEQDVEARGLPTLVHEAVRAVMLHELDEAFHVDGVRVNDPHKNEVPVTTYTLGFIDAAESRGGR